MAATVKKATVAGTTATLISASPAFVMGVSAVNATGATAYVQLFDAAAAANVSLGTTKADWAPLKVAATDSAGDASIPKDGLFFRNGVCAAGTTTPTGSADGTCNITIALG